MSRRRLALVVCLALSGCGQPYIVQPPAKYRQDTLTEVRFTTDVDATCRALGAVAERGKMIVGCHRGDVTVLPNPCSWPNRSDYADVACHEMAHQNGWPADHPLS